MREAAIITGSAGGIGAALVEAFSHAGFFTIGVDRASTPAADECVIVELSELADDESALASTRERLKTAIGNRNLAALVNNAAVQLLGTVDELTVPDFRRSLDVNVTAAFALIQISLGRLSAARGCIVNIGSIHARLTKPGFSAYAASKAAIETLTRALAVEIGERVRVNAISPAAIDTPMLRAAFEQTPEAFQALAQCHPTGAIGSPEDVASLAVWICRDSPFLNGAVIDLGGGIAGRLHDPL